MRRALVLVAVGCACAPSFDDEPWRVTEPRVLAIRSEPAEARPGERVELTLLIAAPAGTADSRAELGFCLAPRTLAERNAVSASCLDGASPALRSIPLAAAAEIPRAACARFGPDAPPSEPGQPPLRPMDPDPTGGYFVPVRAVLGATDRLAFGLVRLRCALPGAPGEIVSEFLERYTPNANPVIATIGASSLAGGERDPETLGPISAGSVLDLRLRWEAGAAERYPVYDPALVRLVDHTESIRASWYASAGELAGDRAGKSEDEAALGEREVVSRWTAPLAPGPVWLWAVLRDGRGGVSWRQIVIEVR